MKRALCVATLGVALMGCGELVTDPPLSGTIRIAATARNGAPLPGIKAILYTGDRHLGYAQTDATGIAHFARVTIGTYGVQLDLPDEYAPLTELTGVPQSLVAVPLDVEQGSDTTVAFTFLRRGYGAVEATVRDSAGEPIRGIVVTLYNSTAVLSSAHSDNNGVARFEPVAFGNYGTYVTPPDSLGVPGQATIFRDGLTVDRDYVATTSFTLASCRGTLNVTVRDQTNAPVADYPVEVYTWVGVFKARTTDAGGLATVGDVACGEYGVRAAAKAGFTVVEVAGQGYVDGLLVGSGATVTATVFVVAN